MRENIVKSMIYRKFDPIEETLEKEKLSLGTKLYNIFYSETVRNQIEDLPKGWLPESNSISFRAPSCGYQCFYFSEIKAGNRESKRFLDKDNGTISLTRENKTHCKILDLIETLTDKQDAYTTERKAAQTAAMALLNSVTTVNKAIEVWPEAEFFIRQAVSGYSKSNAPLPVVMTENLNKQLGLPPSKKEIDANCS